MLFIFMFLLQIWGVKKRSGGEKSKTWGSKYKVTCGYKHRLQVENVAEQRYSIHHTGINWKWNKDIYQGGRETQCWVWATQTATHLQKLLVLSFDCALSDNSLHPTRRRILTQQSDRRNMLMRHCSVCSGFGSREHLQPPLQIKWQNVLRTLLWSQCSSPRLQSRPPTCHRGIQCTVCKTWHFHSSPDHAGSTLQRKVNRTLSISMHRQGSDISVRHTPSLPV